MSVPTVTITAVAYQTGVLTYTSNLPLSAALLRVNGLAVGFYNILAGVGNIITNTALQGIIYGGTATNNDQIRILANPTTPISNTYTQSIPANPSVTICNINQKTGTLTYNSSTAVTAFVYINSTQLTPSFTTGIGTFLTVSFDELKALPYGGDLTNGNIITMKTAAAVQISDSLTVTAPTLQCVTLDSLDLETGRLTFSPTANITAFISIDNGAPQGDPIYTGTLFQKTITSPLLVSAAYGGPLVTGTTYTICLKTVAETVSNTLTVSVPSIPTATITNINYLTGTMTFNSTAIMRAYITINGTRTQCSFLTSAGTGITRQDNGLISYLNSGTLQNGDIITLTTIAGVIISNSFTVVLPTASITSVNTSVGTVSFTTTGPMSFYIYKNGIRIAGPITATSGSQSFTLDALKSYLYGGQVTNGDYITFGTASGTMITSPFNISVEISPISITALDYNTGELSYTATQPAKVFLYINGIKQATEYTIPAGSGSLTSSSLIASIYSGSLNNGDTITFVTNIGYVLSTPNPYIASFPTSSTADITGLDQYQGLVAYAAPAAVVVKVLKNGIPIGAKFALTPPSGTTSGLAFKSVTYGGPLVNNDKLRLALDVSNIPISPEFTVVVPTLPFITITDIDYTTGDITFTTSTDFTGQIAINNTPIGSSTFYTSTGSPQTINIPSLKSSANGGQLNNNDIVTFVTPDSPFTALSNAFTATIGTDVTLLDLNEETGELTYNATGAYSVKLYLNGTDSGLTFTTSTPSGSFTDIALVSQLYGGALANNTTLQTYDTTPEANSNIITSFVPSIPCVTITAIDFTTGQVSYDVILPGSSTINAIMRLEGTNRGTSFTLSNGSGQTLTVSSLASIYYGGLSQNTDEIVMAATTTAGVGGTGQIISNTYNVSITAPITISSVDIITGIATYTTTFTDVVEIYINNTATGITFTPSTTPSSTITDNVLKGTIYGGSVGNSHPVEFRKAGNPFSTIIFPIVPPANTTITITAIDYNNGILYYTAAATSFVSVYINGTSYGAEFYAMAGTGNVTRTQLRASQFGGLLISGDQVRLGTNVPIYMSNTFTAAPPNPISITISNVNQATGDLTYTSTDSGFNASPFVNGVSTGQVFTVQGSQTFPFGSTLVTTLNGGPVANGATIVIKNTLGVTISNTFTITFPTLPVATINFFRGTDGTFGYTSTAAIRAKIYINGSDTGASTITLTANSPGTSYITAAQLKTNLYGGPIADGDLLSLRTLDGLQTITTTDYTISVPIPPFVTITALDLANGILSYTSTAEAEAYLQINDVTIPGTGVQNIQTSPPTRTITSLYLAAVTNGGAVSTGTTIRFYTGTTTISYPYTATVPIVIFINSVDPSTGNPSSGDVKYTCTSTVSVFPAINGVKITTAPYPITILASSPPGNEDTINIPEFAGLAIGDFISFVDAADTTVSTTYYAYWLQYYSGNNPSAIPPITENALVSDTQVNLCGTNIVFTSRQLFGAVDNFTFSFTLPIQTLQTVGNVLNIGLNNQAFNQAMGVLQLVVQSSTLSGFPIISGKNGFNQFFNSFTNVLGSTLSINYIKAGDSDYNTLYDFVYIKNETSGAILSSMSLIGESLYGLPGTPPFNGQIFPPWYVDIRGAIGYNPPGANIPYSITNMTRGVTVKPTLPTSLTPTCYLFNNQKTALSPYQMNTNTDPTLLFQASLSYITVAGGGISDLLWLDDGTATGKIFTTNNLVSTTDGSRVYRINTNAEKVYQTQFLAEITDTLQTIPACDNKGYLYGASQVAYWRVDQRIAYPTWRTSIASSSGTQNGPFREPLLTTTGFLFCFNKQNGMNKIDTSTGLSVASCTFTGTPVSISEMVMTADQSFIYFIGRDSSFQYLYKIQTSDCTEVSRITLSGSIVDFNDTPRICFDGTSVYAYRDVNLYSVDVATGALNWTNTSATNAIRSIAIGPSNTIFLSARDRFVRAINSSGVLQWTSDNVNANNIQLIVDQANRVYCAGDFPNITLTALDGATGSQLWQKSYGGNTIRSPTIGSDGKLYVTANNILYAYAN